MIKKDFILFTTCEPSNEARVAELKRLMDSVDKSFNADGISAIHVILLQSTTQIPFETEPYLQAGARHFLTIDRRVSLSKARNIMIEFAISNALLDQAELCAFPDDDAWYPDGFMKQTTSYFSLNKNQDILITKYGSKPISNPKFDELKKTVTIQPSSFIRNTSSNTLFIRTALVKSVGLFDEKLGLGAEINGGEDLDYGLRAFCLSNKPIAFFPEVLVGHRDPMRWVVSKYYSGSLYAIGKSASSSPKLAFQFIRKIAVGIYLVITNQLAFTEFRKGTMQAIKAAVNKG
jgi:hypothetical protein